MLFNISPLSSERCVFCEVILLDNPCCNEVLRCENFVRGETFLLIYIGLFTRIL